MNAVRVLILIVLLGIGWNQVDQYHERHDNAVYYASHNAPYPLVDLDHSNDRDAPHLGGYPAGARVTYKIERTLYLSAATAKVTRRIVRKFAYQGGVAREPIYSFPVQPAARIDPGWAISFVAVDLPEAKLLPPGEYIIETSLEFPVHGELRTYVADTQPFQVVK